MGKVYELVRGEDRTMPLRAFEKNADGTQGNPFPLTSVTNIAVKLPTEDGYLERLLNDRAELWVVRILSVAASTDYKAAVDGTEVTYTSEASTSMAAIRAGLVAALDALSGVSASAVGDVNEIHVISDTAGSGGTFEMTTSTGTYVSVVKKEAGLDGGAVTITNAEGAAYEVDLPDSVTDELNVAAAQNFEVVVDKSTERRIIRYLSALTVHDSVFAE